MNELAEFAEHVAALAAPIPRLERELLACAAALRQGQYGMFLNGARKAAENMLRAAIGKSGDTPPSGDLTAMIAAANRLGLISPKLGIHVETIRRFGNYGSHGQEDDLLDDAVVPDEDLSDESDVTLTSLRSMVSWFVEKYGAAKAAAPSVEPKVVAQTEQATATAMASTPSSVDKQQVQDLRAVSDFARSLEKALGEKVVEMLREDLGRSTRGGLSAQMVNELLEMLGLQKRGDGVWQLTEQGKTLGLETANTDWRGETIRTIRWKSETEGRIQGEILRRIGVAPQTGEETTRTDWMSARQIGEALQDRLGIAGSDLLRGKLGRNGENGSVSAQMVNELLEQIGYVIDVAGDRRLTALGQKYGQAREAQGRPGIRIFQWDPATVDAVAKRVEKLVGTQALKEAEEQSQHGYFDVAELSGAKALDYGLAEFIADITGQALSLVRRRLKAKSQMKVKNIFGLDTREFIGALTVRKALDYELSEAIAELLDEDEAAVRRKLKKVASANTRVASVFGDDW